MSKRSRRAVSRRDRNIRLNINIQRRKIRSQKPRRRTLNLSIINTGLHLHILQIRRSRRRLRHKHGVRIIRIDIRRPSPIARTLQLQRGEKTSDDRQIGTNKPNSRLNMRPQGRLVHRIRGIIRTDPEEHDDPVDTSETDERA